MLVRHALTPLTTVSLEIGREGDRFVFSPFRDSDSTRIVGTATLQPLALINGTAAVGYRRFTPLAPDVAPYRGMTALVRLSYSVLGTTRFGVDVARDVQPSFEIEQPFYLETGIGLTVQQQVFGPFDALARIGTRRLAYRDRAIVATDVTTRTDRVREFGVGGGYRLGTDKRIGLTVDRQSRTSGIDAHEFSGIRVGASLTYER